MPKLKIIITVDEEALNASVRETLSEEELAETSLETKIEMEMGWCKGISISSVERIKE